MIRLILAALVLATPAFAQAPVPVPTGYQVPGCTFYRLVNGKVVPICNEKEPAEFVKALALADHPLNRTSSGGADATSK